MRFVNLLASFVVATVVAGPASAQAPAAPAAPPPFATTKVADNVYVFRYGGHQSMFIVTPAGVIATDPIAYQRPQAAQAYIDEIRKITPAPIKYLVYSHHHYDHSAGGKPFKDAGATFVAHRNARTRLEAQESRRRAARHGRRRAQHDRARRHAHRPHLRRTQPLGQFARHVPAEGEDSLRRRFPLARQ